MWSPNGPSILDSAKSTYPSSTISAWAGTSISEVSHFTISTGFARKNPAIIISSRSGGSGRMAEYMVAGSAPIATATGMRACLPSFCNRR